MHMLRHGLAAVLSTLALAATAQPLDHQLDAALPALAEKEAPALLETLRALTAPDSGSGQAPGLAAVADVIEQFARRLGGEVRRVTPANNVVGPNLVITFRGTGKRRIMLMSHMDTVYPAGTAAAKPMRIDGNRAIAPGIADDKGGIAVFLHAVQLLQARGFRDYERITMVFNSDEERGSSGSRDLIRSQAREHDAILSGEPTQPEEGTVLGTSGVGGIRVKMNVGGPFGPADARAAEELADFVLRARDLQQEVPQTRLNWTLLRVNDPAGPLRKLSAGEHELATLTFRVQGKGSHAGVAPQLGVNALMEAAAVVRRVNESLAQVPGARWHWRHLSGGLVGNIIPDRGQAILELALPRGTDPKPVLEKLAARGAEASLAGAQVTSETGAGLGEASGPTEATASADVRVPDADAFSTLAKIAKQKMEQKKFPASGLGMEDGLFFPAYNASPEGQRLAATAQKINEALGGRLAIIPRTYGGTDAVWAAQSGKPVLESMGLPGGNYHSSDEEYVLVDRIPRRLALVAEMIRAVALQK
jgi:acetylornithine deacetylase/succinyl-diaminopimelate desuccinylase-like protein